MNPRARVPVCVVSGLTSPDKRSFIHALLAGRPADIRWALLDNDGGDFALDAATPQLAVSVIHGCACCSGQLALQTGIVQLIRQARPQRLIVAASGAAEPAELERALQQEHLARSISIDHRLCVLATDMLQGLPPGAQDLQLRQIAAAAHVVCRDAAAAAAALGDRPASNLIQFRDAVRLVLASPMPVSSASSLRIDS